MDRAKGTLASTAAGEEPVGLAFQFFEKDAPGVPGAWTEDPSMAAEWIETEKAPLPLHEEKERGGHGSDAKSDL